MSTAFFIFKYSIIVTAGGKERVYRGGIFFI